MPSPDRVSAKSPGYGRTSLKTDRSNGQTTKVKEQVTKSQSGRGMGVQVSRSMQEVQRPLLAPDECVWMPGRQKNEHDLITTVGDMVVYCAGFPAICGRQPLYFQDPTFAEHAKISSPKHSDSTSGRPAPEVKIL